VTVNNKHISNQYNLSAQIEQVHDKIVFMYYKVRHFNEAQYFYITNIYLAINHNYDKIIQSTFYLKY